MNGREWEKQKGSRCGQQHRRRRRSRLFVGCYYAQEKGQPTNWWTCFSICCFCCCMFACSEEKNERRKKMCIDSGISDYIFYYITRWWVGWLMMIFSFFGCSVLVSFLDNWTKTGVKTKNPPLFFFRGFKMMNLSIIIRFRFRDDYAASMQTKSFFFVWFGLFCFVFSSMLNGRIGKELDEKMKQQK